MKTFFVIVLSIGALALEVNLFINWYLPYMDYDHIGFVYICGLICRCILYAVAVAWFDNVWDKYLIKNK